MDILTMLPTRWIEIDGVEYSVTNVTAVINLSKTMLASKSLFLTYTIRDYETPRDIASRLYDDGSLYWAIIMVNEITNIVRDWPKSNEQIYENLVNEYGYEGVDELVAYVDPNGNIVDLNGIRRQYQLGSSSDNELVEKFELSTVTRLEIAEIENEAKRNIRVIDPSYILEFQTTVRQALAS